jgi:glycosyltransferase involved in cell wall biosynthesis
LIQGGLPAEKIRVKPNWHEPDPGIRKEADGSILFIGRLTREKGIETVLEAWDRMKSPPLLRIIGDGPLREKVECAARQQGEKCIEYFGNRPHEEVIARLKQASVFLLPCEWYEGFPHTILEAYACGVPIIASRIGTLADVVLDGKTGILFEPGNAADMAAKLEAILEDPEKLRVLGNAGRREYETKYTGRRIYEELFSIYTGLMETAQQNSSIG